MQYIDHTQQQGKTYKDYTIPSQLEQKEWLQTTTDMPPTITTQRI